MATTDTSARASSAGPSSRRAPRPGSARSGHRRARWNDRDRLPLYLVAAAVLFGLVVLWPEHRDVWYLNDASVHRSMTQWAADRIREGHLPFDGWYPYLSLGASRFHHYQSLPHILTGALSVVLGAATFRWSLYLLLAAWPIAVYAGARLLGLSRWPAAAAALISPLLSSAPGLGYEWGSYVWRGSGAWAQLWGMWALPFAWGLSWQAVARGRRIWLAALVLALTICVHLLTGYLALVSLAVFVLVVPGEAPRRIGRAALVAGGALAASAWMLVPLLTDAGWTVNDAFSRGTFYYDSFGARKVLGWMARGALFDAGRLPVLTALFAVGLVVALVQARRREPARVVVGLGLVALLLFFGRPTLGPALRLLPGSADLFFRRFISGVHLAGIYLMGIGAVWLVHAARAGLRRLTPARIPALVAVAAASVLLLAPSVVERVRFERQGGDWIDQQAGAQATDGLGYQALVERAATLGPGRIFSELRGPRVASYRIGQVPAYAALLNLQADAVGFTRPTWSLASPAEFRFDPASLPQRGLFGVRYVIWPEDHPLPSARRIAQAGRHVLWEIPDVSYLQVVDTVAPIAADRADLGTQMSSFLSSGLVGAHMVPTVAFGGRTPAAPTLGPGQVPRAPPGTVEDPYARIEDGVFGGTVRMTRPGVVLVSVSYDPRFAATVDGAEVPTQMLAPGVVGIPVGAGTHRVELAYAAYPYYLELWLVGLAAILGLWWWGRRPAHAVADSAYTESADVAPLPSSARS